LLPEKPGDVEQSEYEERTRVGFALERLAREGGYGREPFEITNPDR
jgi:hypothetical protein